jgi:hypothetical protein
MEVCYSNRYWMWICRVCYLGKYMGEDPKGDPKWGPKF